MLNYYKYRAFCWVVYTFDLDFWLCEKIEFFFRKLALFYQNPIDVSSNFYNSIIFMVFYNIFFVAFHYFLQKISGIHNISQDFTDFLIFCIFLSILSSFGYQYRVYIYGFVNILWLGPPDTNIWTYFHIF